MVVPPGYPFASMFSLSQVLSDRLDQFHPFPGLLFGPFVSEDIKRYAQIRKADVTNNMGPLILMALFFGLKVPQQITYEIPIRGSGRMSVSALSDSPLFSEHRTYGGDCVGNDVVYS